MAPGTKVVCTQTSVVPSCSELTDSALADGRSVNVQLAGSLL
eukprot:CAMPEP_0172813758 /NCGR_PEP_ID=MMETSP1075-20121228/10852_1 /TAXON_ID=2916 /ORGANISM="Ceratium fusus, Strain PA161109" /LENGTH=41 /DNA_ID= /DNA_START= /DNA_END= /DNA_ORIENTATION=